MYIIFTYVCMHIYIYIYRERERQGEREREREILLYIIFLGVLGQAVVMILITVIISMLY